MYRRLHGDTANAEWNYGRRVAMHHAVDGGEPLEDFTVDVALDESSGSVAFYR